MLLFGGLVELFGGVLFAALVLLGVVLFGLVLLNGLVLLIVVFGVTGSQGHLCGMTGGRHEGSSGLLHFGSRVGSAGQIHLGSFGFSGHFHLLSSGHLKSGFVGQV